ncbi:hypothetical protein [Azospirillum doebereinerae]
MDPIAKGNYISSVNKDMQDLGNKKGNSAKIISGYSSSIEFKNNLLSEKIKISNASQTDLVREMMNSMRDDINGKGDGSSYWMMALFFVIVIMDMFAVVSKAIMKSEIYDARIQEFEVGEAAIAKDFGEKFNTRFMDEEPKITDVIEANRNQSDHSDNDKNNDEERSFIARKGKELTDYLEKKWDEYHK